MKPKHTGGGTIHHGRGPELKIEGGILVGVGASKESGQRAVGSTCVGKNPLNLVKQGMEPFPTNIRCHKTGKLSTRTGPDD